MRMNSRYMRKLCSRTTALLHYTQYRPILMWYIHTYIKRYSYMKPYILLGLTLRFKSMLKRKKVEWSVVKCPIAIFIAVSELRGFPGTVTPSTGYNLPISSGRTRHPLFLRSDSCVMLLTKRRKFNTIDISSVHCLMPLVKAVDNCSRPMRLCHYIEAQPHFHVPNVTITVNQIISNTLFQFPKNPHNPCTNLLFPPMIHDLSERERETEMMMMLLYL